MGKKVKKFWNFKALDEKTGELTLYGEISDTTWWGDEITPKQFKEDLDALGDIDVLNIYINSYGGDVFAGQTIYSILKRHKAKKNVYVDGLAASIASLVVMAGDKVIMPANAMMMIHNHWTLAAGNANDFRKIADDLDKIRDSMIVAYQEKSGLEKDEIISVMDAETWLTAEECKEKGFADEIEEAKQVAAHIDEKYFAIYKNVPEKLKKARNKDDGMIQFDHVEFAKAILPAIKDELQREGLINIPSAKAEEKNNEFKKKKMLLELEL